MGTTLFTQESVYLPGSDFIYLLQQHLWKQNKVVPNLALCYAQMHEFDVNLSRSQNCSWIPLTSITGKIKLFPDLVLVPIISVPKKRS
jgi:hypothetical protein